MWRLTGRQAAFLLLGAALIAWFIYVYGTSEPFGKCIHYRKNYQAYKALHEETLFAIKFLVRLQLNSVCAVHVANVYQGAITALAGVVVAAFTFTLWVSTHLLWKTGEKQLMVAVAAANAAERAAEIGMVGQRAWILVTPSWSHVFPPGIFNDTGVYIGPQITAVESAVKRPGYNFGTKMENIGGTTASDIRNHIDFVIVRGELPDDFEFPDAAPPLTQGGMIGPKQWLLSPHVPLTGAVSADDIDKIQKEEIRFYFYGWVKYRDGFPGTPERTTNFCYFIRVTGNQNTPVVFIPHKLHNTAN